MGLFSQKLTIITYVSYDFKYVYFIYGALLRLGQSTIIFGKSREIIKYANKSSKCQISCHGNHLSQPSKEKRNWGNSTRSIEPSIDILYPLHYGAL